MSGGSGENSLAPTGFRTQISARTSAQTPKVEDRPFSTVCDYLFNVFVAILI